MNGIGRAVGRTAKVTGPAKDITEQVMPPALIASSSASVNTSISEYAISSFELIIAVVLFARGDHPTIRGRRSTPAAFVPAVPHLTQTSQFKSGHCAFQSRPIGVEQASTPLTAITVMPITVLMNQVAICCVPKVTAFPVRQPSSPRHRHCKHHGAVDEQRKSRTEH